MIFQSKAVCDAEAGQSLDLNNVAAALAVRLLFYAIVDAILHPKKQCCPFDSFDSGMNLDIFRQICDFL